MSNSLLVDDNESSTPGDLDKLRKDLTEATTTPAAHKEEARPESKIPEKYQGKSIEDVIEMHRNAESELGRRGNELGQYKRLTDDLLDLKRRSDLAKGGAEEEEIEDTLPKISSTDLLDDPNEALEKLFTAREKSQERRRQKTEAQKAQEELEKRFANAHPDAEAIVNSPEFVQWVQGSTARSLLGYQAAQGDLVAGDALLQEWKSSSSTEMEVEERRQENPIEKARKASTESQGTSRTPDAPAGKIYRRLDLIRLKLEDPEAYADEGFQQEIIRAYNEGRVK